MKLNELEWHFLESDEKVHSKELNFKQGGYYITYNPTVNEEHAVGFVFVTSLVI